MLGFTTNRHSEKGMGMTTRNISFLSQLGNELAMWLWSRNYPPWYFIVLFDPKGVRVDIIYSRKITENLCRVGRGLQQGVHRGSWEGHTLKLAGVLRFAECSNGQGDGEGHGHTGLLR